MKARFSRKPRPKESVAAYRARPRVKLLLDDGDEHVGRYRAPDLRLHGVLAGAEEFLDSKVLLDPFEEQLDLPAALVKRGDSQRWQEHVVGEEHQGLAGVGIFEADTPQVLGIVLGHVEAVQGDTLIAHHTRCSVGGGGVDTPGIHAAFRPRDEESTSLMHLVEPSEVEVTAIHDIEGACFEEQQVEHIDLVQLAIADVNEGRNGAAQIQQGMHLDGGFGRAKGRPVEQAQAQIDRGGIECIDRVAQVQPQILVVVKLPGAANEDCSKVGPDTPISRLVRIGQGGAMDGMAQTHGIEFVDVGTQRHLDVAQTLAPSQLRKRHDAKLLGARHAAHARVARVAFYNARKARPWDELHDLREERLADIHGSSPGVWTLGNYTRMRVLVSNRHQNKSAARPRHHWLSEQLTPV